MKVTLREIASRAGVHYSTASHILNGARGSTHVSDATRRRVVEVAEDLGYYANRAAQQLRTRRSRVVGLLVGDLENPFFARLFSLCADALAEHGYEVVLAVRRGQQVDDLHLVRTLNARQVDGLLLWNESCAGADAVFPGSRRHAAVVLGYRIPGIDSIEGALDEGVEAAITHLVERGRRRIGYVAPAATLDQYSDPRSSVYRRAVTSCGMTPVIRGFDGDGHDMTAARAGVAALIADYPDLDALLCFNDMVAIGALMGLRNAGLRVPDDIALVGCDNVPLAASLDVPITTIAYPLEKMCRLAVDKLLEHLNAVEQGEAAPPPETLTIPTELIVRASSAGKERS
jgi:LacI family transcriptional regulator